MHFRRSICCVLAIHWSLLGGNLAKSEVITGQQRIDILRQMVAANRANFENLDSLVVNYACQDKIRIPRLPADFTLPTPRSPLVERLHEASRTSAIVWRWRPKDDVFYVELIEDESKRRFFDKNGGEISIPPVPVPDPSNPTAPMSPIQRPSLGFAGKGLFCDQRFTYLPQRFGRTVMRVPTELIAQTAIQNNRNIQVLDDYMRIPEKPITMFCLGHGPEPIWQSLETYAKRLAGDFGAKQQSYGEAHYRLETARDGYRLRAGHGDNGSPPWFTVEVRVNSTWMVTWNEQFILEHYDRKINKPELQKKWTYQQFNDIYVPATFEQTRYLPFDKNEPGKLSYHRKYRLIEATVNEPIPAEQLSLAAIGLRDNDFVRNQSLKQEYLIRDSQPIAISSRSTDSSNLSEGGQSWRWWFGGAFCILFGCIVVVRRRFLR